MSQESGIYPEDLRYTREHEWVAIQDGTGTVGITHYAQTELGDIVYVELPRVGAAVVAGEEFGTVESVKAVSEIYAPVSGEVAEVNGALTDRPELVNKDPYGAGWLVRIRLAEPVDLKGLLTVREYRKFVEDESN
ncbi:MAG TPA: glycine cleavage system protein GcvH [Candidatus Polarisedimenticolia bacterium]|nr:glycine cleavage system protein GcvH [Candidatus Polarisedimenticolia bacterium]